MIIFTMKEIFKKWLILMCSPFRNFVNGSLRRKGNNKRKMHNVKRNTTSLKDLSKELTTNALVFKFSTYLSITCSKY